MHMYTLHPSALKYRNQLYDKKIASLVRVLRLKCDMCKITKKNEQFCRWVGGSWNSERWQKGQGSGLPPSLADGKHLGSHTRWAVTTLEDPSTDLLGPAHPSPMSEGRHRIHEVSLHAFS